MAQRVSHYEIEERIGSGGFATVYRARDTRKGETVALKMLHPHLAANPALVDRFRREMLVAARLYHDNIVRILDFGEEEGVPFLVMEYLPRSLDKVLHQQGPLPVDEAVDIAVQVLCALDCARERDVIHRDIKPQNVLVAADGTMKVADFGLAKALDISGSLSSEVMGTPHYMSPEQALGRPVDIRTDVYSLGAMLYRMLAGRVPFDADTPFAVVQKLYLWVLSFILCKTMRWISSEEIISYG